MQDVGKLLLIIGVALVLAGLILYGAGDRFTWLGRLPGDIRIEKENFNFYFPITTMILVSIVLTLLIRFWQYFK